MTPLPSLTFEGYLQGLQAQTMGLVYAAVILLVVLFLTRWIIGKVTDSPQEAYSGRRTANKIAFVIALLVLAGFAFNAATYSTNAIPHTDLDKSGVYQQMDSNTKPR